jgi:hypothetical protein
MPIGWASQAICSVLSQKASVVSAGPPNGNRPVGEGSAQHDETIVSLSEIFFLYKNLNIYYNAAVQINHSYYPCYQLRSDADYEKVHPVASAV